MYEMAKKAREAMRGKAKRLAGEKDSKTDSSTWTPAEALNAGVKTGMRPISKQGFKAEGGKDAPRADRKARKSGGRALTADSLVNRNVKDANAERSGIKHVGGLKTGGRAKKAMGGAPTDMLKQVRGQTMGFKKGGKIKKADGGIEGLLERNPPTGNMPDKSEMVQRGATSSKGDMSAADQARAAAATRAAAADRAAEARTEGERRNPVNRKAGGKVNYGPMEMPDGKKGPSTKQMVAEEKREQNMSKPKRGKASCYADGGMPDPRMSIVDKNKMGGAFQAGSPYKKGGMAKHEDVAEDKALIKKMVKPSARTAKFGGGALSMPNMGPGKPEGLATGGKAKGKTNINIMINPGAPKADQNAGMPGLPPGMPPAGPGGVPVPMGMPPGGAPPAAAPMPMPMPMPVAGPSPMARKAGGKVYKSYKDMDAGAGSGLGRLEKTEIQKRKA